MNWKWTALATLTLSLIASGALAKQAKVDICHWDEGEGVFFVINISVNAADKHIANHGDVYPATWWADGDGDGFGDPAGATDPCPNAGFVDNAEDCDDGNPATHPGAEEVCDNDVDDDCDGEIDEGCLICPCFSVADLDAAYAEWLADDYTEQWMRCNDVDYWYYDFGYIELFRRSYQWPHNDYEYEQFYAFGYDYYYDYDTCLYMKYDYDYDYLTGQYDWHEQTYETVEITHDEVDACRGIMVDWILDHGMSCDGTQYPAPGTP